MFEQTDHIADIFNLTSEMCGAELKRRFDEKGAINVLAEIGTAYGNNLPLGTLNKLSDFVRSYFSLQPHPVHTIGVYYWHITIGGVQRVITSQFPIFRELGMKIIFFTDALPEENEYPLPDYVKRVYLPVPDATTPDFYEKLAECAEIIKAENVDIFYNHIYSSTKHLLWFALLCKTVLKIPLFNHIHNVFSASLTFRNPSCFALLAELYKMADLCIVLSSIDNLYFSISGIRSVYLPNQYFLPEDKPAPKEIKTGHTILFLSRIDFWAKRPLDVIPMMEHLIDKIPDAKLLIVGGGKKEDEDLLNNAISQSKAAGNIEFCGQTLEIVKYYQVADVFFVTSRFEGFPLTLLEAQAFGIPVVCYDMPYLEIIRHPENGIITVPQEEPAAAADAIANLLTDPELYRTKSCNGVKTAKYFSEYDLFGAWKKILTDWTIAPAKVKLEYDELNILFDTIRQHHYWGSLKIEKLLSNLSTNQKQLTQEKIKLSQTEVRLKQAQNALTLQTAETERYQELYDNILHSFPYRFGRVIAWLPHKIHRGIQCMKENGFLYTVKRFYSKIIKKFFQ